MEDRRSTTRVERLDSSFQAVIDSMTETTRAVDALCEMVQANTSEVLVTASDIELADKIYKEYQL